MSRKYKAFEALKSLCVENVVSALDSGCSSTWWYPHRKLSFENSSSVECHQCFFQCWYLITTSFARCILTQTCTSPLDFGTATKGETRGVGSSTSSIIWRSCNSWSFFSTSLWTWNRTRCCGCATGVTFGLMCIFQSANTMKNWIMFVHNRFSRTHVNLIDRTWLFRCNL